MNQSFETHISFLPLFVRSSLFLKCLSRLATVFVSEVQAALKHADPNNASYVESWKEELLDIFKAQNTDVEGVSFTTKSLL